MKTIVLLGLFVLFLTSIQMVGAQTVDDIIDKHIAARGGKEKLASLKSIYMEGMREMMGNEVVIKITKEQDKLSRTDFEMGGNNGFMLVTDKEAWSFIPMRSPSPTKLPDEALANMQTETDIAGPLFNYADKGSKAELLGKDSAQGATCYKLKVTTKAGREINCWIDASTYLLLQTSTKGGGMMGGGGGGRRNPDAELFTIYKDYKAVDGIMIAHTIETKVTGGNGPGGGGGTTFDVVKINPAIDAKAYKPE
ncbi:MAG: hypothetical protein RL172_944 [Bacteroidota bacterium]